MAVERTVLESHIGIPSPYSLKMVVAVSKAVTALYGLRQALPTIVTIPKLPTSDNQTRRDLARALERFLFMVANRKRHLSHSVRIGIFFDAC